MTNSEGSLNPQFRNALSATHDVVEIASAQLIVGQSAPTISKQLLEKIPSATAAWVTGAPLAELFAVLSANASVANRGISGDLLAAATQRLIDCEVAPGGPYQDEQGRINLAANIHIYLFLEAMGAHLIKLQKYIDQHPNSDLPSYCAYKNSKGLPCTPPTALLAAVLKLTNTEHKSMALAFAPINKKYAYVKIAAKQRLNTLPHPLNNSAHKLFNRVLKADTTKEMLLLPYFFAKHIPSNIDSSDLTDICVANLFCWMGYAALDDALDEKNTTQLPVATTLITLSQQIYTGLPNAATFLDEFYSIFLLMDQANALEISHRAKIKNNSLIITSLPQFDDQWLTIGAKSSGHILGALYQLQQTPLPKDQKADCKQALQSYLIARQLQDDLYDWKEDIQRGHITHVVHTILQDARIAPGTHSFATLLPKLEVAFWQQSLAATTALIQKHIALSQRFFKLHPASTGHSNMTELIEHIALTTLQAAQSNMDQKKFLQAFKSQAKEQ